MMLPSARIASCSTAFNRSSNATVFRTRNQRRDRATAVLVLEASGVIEIRSQTFDDRGLADAGLTDQHRLFLVRRF
jgi:hypothetical protein